MKPEWILAGIGLVQLGATALIWRGQRDQARAFADLKEWIHANYMPRELADERFVKKPEISGFPGVSQQARANS